MCDGPAGVSPSGETAGQSIPEFIFSCKRDRGIWVGIALLVNKLARACHWRGLFCFRPPGAICPPSLVLRGVSGPPRGPIVVFLLQSVHFPSVQFVSLLAIADSSSKASASPSSMASGAALVKSGHIWWQPQGFGKPAPKSNQVFGEHLSGPKNVY